MVVPRSKAAREQAYGSLTKVIKEAGRAEKDWKVGEMYG